jgi:hypothetical protein
MKTKKRYGLEFDERVPDWHIDLMCARCGGHIEEYKAANLDDLDVHFLRAIRALFEPSEFKINSWSEQIVNAWCYNQELCLFGCSSSNKSHTTGLVALLDWITFPHDTSTFFASTTVKALERRSWASIIQFYQVLAKKGAPIKHLRSKTAILNARDAELEEQEGIDAPESVKSGVFGIAVMAGSLQDAVSNIIGVHQNRVLEGMTESIGGVRVFADEAQGTRQGLIDACINLAIGTPDFRLVLMGNPMSHEDPLGIRACPKDGWDSVSPSDQRWETKTGGLALHFDGHQSPAVLEENGEREYPFLIGPKHIELVKKRCHNNIQHPDYMTMVRGWISNSGDPDAVMPKAMQVHNGMYDEGIGWITPPTRLMSLDPSYTSRGDDAVVVMADAGIEKDGIFRIVFLGDPIPIPIKDLPDNPPVNQIIQHVWDLIARYYVDTRYLVVDETATQTVGSTMFLLAPPGVADMAARPLLFNGNTSPSDLPVSIHDPRKGSDTYATATTEAWYWLEAFSRFGQIRNFPKKAGAQLASRRMERSARRRGSIQLESKKKLSDRGISSPNEADACAMIMALVRHRLRATPGDFRHDALRAQAMMTGLPDHRGFGGASGGLQAMIDAQEAMNQDTNTYTGDDW